MKIIEILISPPGEAVVQTHGYTGAACQDASRFLELALGEREAEQLTLGFYQTEPQQEPAKQQS